MRNVRMKFSGSEIQELETLIAKLERYPKDKQKNIRNKLRKKGLYWSEFAKGYEYTVANFYRFINQGVIIVENMAEQTLAASCQDKICVSNMEPERRIKCFAPVVDSESEILILGTMPSPESLRKNEYYANSRNSFWKIIAAIYNNSKEFENYEDKLDCIHKNHLALWDVYNNCEREGALDSNIEKASPNDLHAFLKSHPSIKKVILNGHNAEKAFTLDFPHEYATSSSSTNSKKLDIKVLDWKSKLFIMNKPNKDPMEWEVLESEYLYKRPWLTARREHVKLPTGAEIKDFYVLEYPEFCNVIAITKDGKFLMERQYRHAQHLTGMEIPAGCVEEGEDPMEAAKRELYEETGFGGGEWSKFMTISPNAGACTNYSHTFLAIGVEQLSSQHLEESEDIKIMLMEQDEVIRMLKNDEFHQAMMAAPLWKYFAMNKLIGFQYGRLEKCSRCSWGN